MQANRISGKIPAGDASWIWQRPRGRDIVGVSLPPFFPSLNTFAGRVTRWHITARCARHYVAVVRGSGWPDECQYRFTWLLVMPPQSGAFPDRGDSRRRWTRWSRCASIRCSRWHRRRMCNFRQLLLGIVILVTLYRISYGQSKPSETIKWLFNWFFRTFAHSYIYIYIYIIRLSSFS